MQTVYDGLFLAPGNEKGEQLNSQAKQLHVQTLGRFIVQIADETLPDSAWGRGKARQLFQYFVTYQPRQTPKERIVAELWPGLDAQKADRDFKVALNALQSALEPDRQPRAPSAYITRLGTSYGLDPDIPLLVDAVEFEAGITAASTAAAHFRAQAIDLYQHALQLYHGEYLPDAIYEDWSSAMRERLSLLYLNGCNRLAWLLLAEGNAIGAIDWSQKVISLDPCWEDAYRLQMRAYMANSNRPLAMRAYQQCRQTLAEALAIEPMAETTALYEQIKQG